ncbi:non-homologous end joining protein Ku [Kaistia sp. MMO-174]|uniref:non-homologous end joining protein Ku n=1 Tax=Kaistia sp. MMO-174 TaxID=3081256 RepID=UPI001AD07BB0|nr:Ku protein [Hyphomicrobiales bacterium]
MAPRAVWKGYLKVSEIICPVALHTAASTSERIAFHTLNRATGNRIRRQFVDEASGKPVESDDQIKGYEIAPGDYVEIDPEEIAAAQPDSDKTLDVEAFVRLDDVDDVYFDRPYYLTPGDRAALEAFVLIRDGMRGSGAAAIARAVLFRKMRSVLIRPDAEGLVATTLSFDYAIRPAREAFDPIPKLKIEGEMLQLAKHIIDTKRGTFEPAAFQDRYEAALAELVKAKLEGRTFVAPQPRKAAKVVDLMAALRESAGVAKPAAKVAKPAAKSDSTKPVTARSGKPARGKAAVPHRKAS